MLIYLPPAHLVATLHDQIIEIAGGRLGVLNHNKIEAAVHRPLTYLLYKNNCDIHTVCAVLMDSLARNHAFVDGNKRTRLMTALMTNELNGYSIKSSADQTLDFENLVLWVVNEKPPIEELAEELRRLMRTYGSRKVSKYFRDVKTMLIPYDSEN